MTTWNALGRAEERAGESAITLIVAPFTDCQALRAAAVSGEESMIEGKRSLEFELTGCDLLECSVLENCVPAFREKTGRNDWNLPHARHKARRLQTSLS
jgi:hypothetical protein